MIDEIFAKVADYHMDHRGHIGLAVGAIAGALFARSGADASVTAWFFEMLFGNDNPAVAQLKLVTSLTGVPSMMLVAAAVVTDAVIHKNRTAAMDEAPEKKYNEEQISRDDEPRGPQPPAP